MAAFTLPPGADLCSIPAAIPPPGETSNFVNPESLATTTNAVSAIMLTLAYLFTAMRLWQNKRGWKWSDYMTIVALLLHTGFTVVIISLNRYNRHQWNVPLCWFDGRYMRLLYANMVLFGSTLFFSKAAIFLLYRDIFWVEVKMRRAVLAGLVASFLLYSTFLPMASYYLAPRIGKSWDTLLVDRPQSAWLEIWGILIGVGSVMLDMFIFVLPLPIVATLKMSRSKRIQLTAVFGAALLGVAAAVLALAYRIKLFQDSSDSTWGQAAVAISNHIENSIAIIVGSGPAFSSFLRTYIIGSPGSLWSRLAPTLRSTFGRNSTRSKAEDVAYQAGGSKELQRPRFGTIGSPWPKSRSRRPPGDDDLELTDSQLLKSDLTVTRYDVEALVDGRVAPPAMVAAAIPAAQQQRTDGIVRTADIHVYQQRRQPAGPPHPYDSTDRLVR